MTQDLHIPGWKIIVSGDSAGFALCLESLIRFYAPNILEDLDAPRTNFDTDLPAGIVASSPLLTPETNSASWEAFEKTDLVSQALAKLVFKEYLDYPNVDPDTLPLLRLSKIRQGFNRFMGKNALVFVGEKEVMRDDIMVLVDAVESDKASNIKLRICKENMVHDWFLIRYEKKVLVKTNVGY